MRRRKSAYDLVKIENRIGVISGIISSTESEDSERFHFFRLRLRLRRLRSSEKFTVVVRSRNRRINQSQGPETNIVISLFFRLSFRPRPSRFHWIVSDGVVIGYGVLLPTSSDWFSLDRIALRFRLRLRLRLRRKWKPKPRWSPHRLKTN